jgi:hypothetical protein
LSRAFLFGALLCVTVLPAKVYGQTVYGPGGLFVHPTAFMEPSGSRANLSWFTQEANGVESRWIPASLTFDLDQDTQAGALYVSRLLRGAERSSGGVFFKRRIIRESVLSPGIAVIGSYLGGDVQQSSLSLAGSWRIPAARGLTLHSGIQWARRADLPVSRDGFSRYMALDAPLGAGFRAVGEIGSRFSFDRKASSAYGLMWSGPGGLEVGVGWVNTGRSDSNRFFIGAGITVAANR